MDLVCLYGLSKATIKKVREKFNNKIEFPIELIVCTQLNILDFSGVNLKEY